MDDRIPASGVGVLDKSVAILVALSDEGPASLAELVERTGLARPTVHRLAVARGDAVVEQDLHVASSRWARA